MLEDPDVVLAGALVALPVDVLVVDIISEVPGLVVELILSEVEVDELLVFSEDVVIADELEDFEDPLVEVKLSDVLELPVSVVIPEAELLPELVVDA